MTETFQENDEIIFGEVLDISMVMEYYEKLNQILNNHKKIIMHIDKLVKVDGAGLQLLLVLVKEATKLNISIHWSGSSEVLKRSADQIAVTSFLGLPE